MDGTLLSEDGGFLLRFERHLPHPVERVFRAVTEPGELAGWFPGQVEIDLVVGGRARFAGTGLDIDPELLPSEGTVTELDPPRLFAFTWGKDLLRFELRPEGGGCLLVFTHRFAARASAPRSAAGWSLCLDLLTAALDGTSANTAAWARYYERYRDELGSEGAYTREGDTAVLNFERLLEHPAGKVWAALTEPGRLAGWLADAEIELAVGGVVELRFSDPPGYLVRGVVTRLDPPRVLEYTWTSTGEPAGTVKWQLIPVGERCILLLTHTVTGRFDEAGTLAAWHVHLSLLASALAGLETWPFPGARWQELHDSYAGTTAATRAKGTA